MEKKSFFTFFLFLLLKEQLSFQSSMSLIQLTIQDAAAIISFLKTTKTSATSLRFLFELNDLGSSAFKERRWYSDNKNLQDADTICQLNQEWNNTTCCFIYRNKASAFRVLRQLSQDGLLDWSRTVFTHLPIEDAEVISQAAALDSAQFSWTEEHNLMVIDNPSSLQEAVSSSPSGVFRVRKLRLEDSEIVNENWKYKSAHSLEMIRSLIARRATAGLEELVSATQTSSESEEITKAEEAERWELAAWILECDNGSMGMLGTRSTSRRRGFGREVARALAARLVVDTQRGALPFCFVTEGNSASMGLFRSLGFRPGGRVAWLRCASYPTSSSRAAAGS